MGSPRIRGLLFAALALGCAAAAASLAGGYRDRVESELGESVPVVVATTPVRAERTLRRRAIEAGFEATEVPARFAPPDALAIPEELIGRTPAAPIPAGSILVGSQFPLEPGGSPGIPDRLRAVELTVSGGGAVAGGVTGSTRVDLMAAGEPNAGGPARVRRLAADVRLVGLQASDAAAQGTPGRRWTATVAVEPALVVDLLEAENYARDLRIIPR